MGRKGKTEKLRQLRERKKKNPTITHVTILVSPGQAPGKGDRSNRKDPQERSRFEKSGVGGKGGNHGFLQRRCGVELNILTYSNPTTGTKRKTPIRKITLKGQLISQKNGKALKCNNCKKSRKKAKIKKTDGQTNKTMEVGRLIGGAKPSEPCETILQIGQKWMLRRDHKKKKKNEEENKPWEKKFKDSMDTSRSKGFTKLGTEERVKSKRRREINCH